MMLPLTRPHVHAARCLRSRAENSLDRAVKKPGIGIPNIGKAFPFKGFPMGKASGQKAINSQPIHDAILSLCA